MESQTPITSISDLRVLAKLRKLHLYTVHEGIPPAMADKAKRAFDKLCKTHGIDPKTIRLDGYRHGDKNVIEVHTKCPYLDANLRAVCILIGEFWRVKVRAIRVRGYLRLDFVAEDPYMPDDAVDAFRVLHGAVDAKWQELLDRYRQEKEKRHQQDAPQSMFRLIGAFNGRPQKKSFISGFFHALHEELTAEQFRRRRWEQLTTPKPKLISSGKPKKKWVRPSRNPLALMCIPKPPQPQPEPEPEPVPDIELPDQAAPPPDETDPDFRQDDPMDHYSFKSGQLAAKTIDLSKVIL